MFLIGRRLRFVIAGNSMLPTLKPHESIFINTEYYTDSHPQEGDVVLAKHPKRDLLIVKRIAWISENDVFLIGDNPNESTDSRQFGVIQSSQIVGKVSSKI